MPWGANPTVFKFKDAPFTPIEETLEVLKDLVKAGKVRHVGLSNESTWGTMTFLHQAEVKICRACNRSRMPTIFCPAPMRSRSPR